MMKRRKRVHYTFRMDEEIFSSIEKEADEKGITTSSLMSRIVQNYVKRDKFLEQLGFIPVGKDVVRAWLNRIEDGFLKKNAQKLGSTIAREYVSYFFHDVNKNTLMQFLDVWLCTLGEMQKREHHGTLFVCNQSWRKCSVLALSSRVSQCPNRANHIQTDKFRWNYTKFVELFIWG